MTSGDLAFPRLKHVSEEDLVDGAGVDLAAFDDTGDGGATELDGAERSQGAAIFPDRGPGDPGDHWVAHCWWMLQAPAFSLLLVKLLNLDHVGIAVNDLERALEGYRDRYRVEPLYREVVEAQGVEEAMIPIGGSFVQLLQPLAGDTPVGRFLESRGEGLHHVAFAVASIDVALDHLREEGARLVDETARAGGRGTRIAFVHPGDLGGTLIELVELTR